ncbi:hypothetical protein Hanom_Chr12g01180301 [Helianthus anomalus]
MNEFVSWLRYFLESVGTLYVDATRLGSIRFGSIWLGWAQARRHDIPPSCAPELDTRSTESRARTYSR